MKAYDIEILHRSVLEGDDRGEGWAYGLPPGITPDQWPRDVMNGYPLQHGFTLRLPPDYRRKGQDLVAVSFFGSAPGHGEFSGIEEISALYRTFRDDVVPQDTELLELWEAERRRHPKLVRMTDILECGYAAIFLTEEEFRGAFCPVPDVKENVYQRAVAGDVGMPDWMTAGVALTMVRGEVTCLIGDVEDDPALVEKYYVTRMLGGVPDAEPVFNRALGLKVRENDPNAGLTPVRFMEEVEGGYQTPEEEDESHQQTHLGGTMSPVQDVPEIGPYYLEFTQEFAGFNFGGGKGWFDLESDAFGWDCG